MKAELYIEKIVEADDEEKAVDILIDIAKDLGIDKRYSALISTKERLAVYQDQFKKTRTRVDVSVPSVELLIDVRREISFAYNSIVDELSSKINEDKIAWGEESRKIAKGEAYLQVMDNEEIKGKVGKAVASLKEVAGTSESYVNWVNCHKVSYANWATYRSILDSWKLYLDYLASAIKNEHTIKIQDQK